MNRQQRRAAAATPGRREADKLLQVLAAGDPAATERSARAVLRGQPDHPVALHVLSTLLFDRGATEEAAIVAERALRAQHAHADLFALAARAHAINGDLEQAVRRFEQACALAPGDAPLHQQLQLARTELEQTNTTREALRAAAREQKEDAGFLAEVAQRFDRTIDGIGVSPAGILHDDEDLHRRTFDVLLGVIEESTRGLFVQDLGCGYGALFDVLVTRDWFSGGRYLGLDVASHMIDAARVRIQDSRATFQQGSELVETSDIVIVAGTWNFKLNTAADVWQTYMRKSLANVAAHARQGFAFNLLHRAHVDSPHLFGTSPGPWLQACRDLGFEPELRSDYSDREFSILARRRQT